MHKLKHILKSIPRYIKFVLSLPVKLLPHRLIKRLSPRNRKIVNLGFITLLLVLGGYFIWTLITPNYSDAAWWNDNWMYRQVATITNSNGSDLTNFQVLVEVDTATLITAGKMKSNCSDIRFTDEGGNLLPYWIETGADACNTSSTNIWLKVPNVYTTGTTVLFYYGNSSAQPVQNGNQVFELFDDFSGNTLDTSKWEQGTIGATSGTNFTVSGGLLSGGNTNRFIRSNAVYTGDYTAEARSYTTTDNANGYMTIGFFETTSNDFGILDHNNTSYYRNDSSWVNFALDGTGQWTKNTTKVVGTDATYARVGETSGSSTATVTNSGLASEYIRISARYDNSAMNQDYVATWDWITVRKAAETDPSASLGGEERSQSPVLYFAFDEGTGTTTKDGSPSRITGTLANPPTWTPESQCISGSCLFFDGSDTDNNQTVVYNESSTSPTNITGDVTISTWIKPSPDYENTSGAILRNGQGADLVYSMFYDYNNKRPFFHWYDGGFPAVQGTTNSVPLDEWSFLTIVRESNVVSFYVNGKLTNSANVTTPTVPSTRMAIGRTDNAGVPQDYSGYVDELKVYPYARSSDQILQDFNTRGGTVSSAVLGATQYESLSQGLVGYWKMDQASWNGTTGEVIDSSGSGNNGTAVNGAEASSSAKFGNAGYFAGVDEYITLGTPTTSSSRSYSIWVKPNAALDDSSRDGLFGESVGTRIDYGNGPGTSSFHALILLSAGSPAYRELTGNGNGTSGWSHLVLTIDDEAGVGKFYVNGSLASTATWDKTTQSATAGTAQYLAYLSGVADYNGNLDEARMYNRALTPEEVTNLYNFAPGPVAYYPFEETTGAGTTADRSSNGLNLPLSNSPEFVLGKYGRAIKFTNGSSQRGNLANALYSLNNYTYGFWFKMDVPFDGTYRSIFTLNGGSDRNPGLWRYNNNTCFHAVQDPGNQGFSCVGPTGNSTYWEVGKWYYYSQTKNNTDLTAYVNGSPVATTTVTNPMTTSATPTMYLGSASGYTAAGVTIDEFRLYNYARTPSQIVQDMNAGHPTGGSPVASQVGYWKFNEGYGTSFGNSGNAGDAINGTFDSTAAWSDGGKFGRALKTNGSATGDASIPDNSAIDFAYNQDFTVSFWMKDGGGNGNDLSVVEKWAVGGGGYPYVFRYVSNSIRFARYDETNNPQILGTKPVNDGNWHYVLGTKNGSTLALYIDGKLQSTTTDTTSGTTTNASPLFLGSRSGTGQLWNGFIDELKIYNSGFSQSQVNLDMNQGSSLVMGSFGLNPDGTASNSAARSFCVPGDNSTAQCQPTAQWSFEENRGRVANDSSTNGYQATFSGNPAWTIGKIGAGLVFNASADYLATNAPTGSDWSVSVWSKFPLAVNGGYRTLIRQGSSVHHILVDVNGLLGVYDSSFASSGFDVDTLSPGWHHIAALGSGGSTVFYIDGRQVGTSAQQVTSNITQIGGIGSSQNWGTIDELRVYDYVLSGAQIAWDYNRGKPVAYYKLDECQGSTANDSSEFRNNGTITIGATGTQTSVGTCQTAGTAWGNGVNGKYNYSLNFDGTDDYFEISQPNILTSPNLFTATGFIKPGAQDGFIITPNSVGIDQWIGYDVDLQRLWVSVATAGDTNQASYYSTNSSVPTGEWTHFAVIIDDRDINIYLNGRLNSSHTHGFDIGGWTGNWRIAQRGNSTNWFLGQLDDLQVFSYDLTDVQIRNLYNQSSAVRFGPNAGAP